MRNLDEMLKESLMDPIKAEKELESQRADRAVVHVRHGIEMHTDHHLRDLSLTYTANALIIQELEEKAWGMSRDPTGIRALFLNQEDALNAALSLAPILHRLKTFTRLGLGWGSGYLLPEKDWTGAEDHRTRRLTEFAGQHEILVTESFAEQLPPPEGVGMFRARKDRAQLVGFNFWVLKDYRY
jgi:class 3 adenylate cyclase